MSSGDLDDWCSRLKNSKKLIVVEGQKDKKCLEEIGIKNDIVVLSKKPLYAVVEEIAKSSKDVVILTDLDRTGRRLFAKLNSDLQNFGVRVDNWFREFLFRHTKVRQIEGLSSYMRNI